ncbi:hypothetical protein [Flavisolibacter ginsenosidimutans]|uniref:Uncharacterized protein n=1 Tax=Flavisolibacter ginsenosidimutans TaxID=661481 RepID=A0A5B8UFA1_9BACT|nr:hypothetical protein [Flavisolibacter ginsenosidimutans]QEC55341.1 hypothetical protein FSB75_05280 [Flavisolibacter ginsenosidimutans]
MKTQKKCAVCENALTIAPTVRPSYEDVELINPKKVPLTPAILRSFDGFEKVTDEEAENICKTSAAFAMLLLQLLARKNAPTIENQEVVYLSEQEQAPIRNINEHLSKPSKNKAA